MAVIKQHSESAGIERTGHFTSYVKKKRMRRHSANASRELLEPNNDVEAVIDVKNFKYVALRNHYLNYSKLHQNMSRMLILFCIKKQPSCIL